MRRQAQLDGLRALAIVMVLAAHAGYASLGGYSGVAIFFVLSGFLITNLLVHELDESGKISVKLFYLRRATRLYPALIVMLGVTVLLGASRRSALVAATYTTNVFDSFGIPTFPYGHTWSLGMEEQFYLLWPLVLPAVMRRESRARRILGLLVLASAGAAWTVAAVTATHGGSGLGTFNPLLRAHGLLIGCILALSLRHRLPAHPKRLVWMGVALLGIGFAIGPVQAREPAYLGWNLLTPEVAAALLIAGIAWQEPYGLAKVFTSRPVVWLGTRSYGVYLWHVPLIALVFLLGFPRNVAALVGIATAIAAAEMSFRWVERPLLRLKDRLRPKPRTSLAATPRPLPFYVDSPRAADPPPMCHHRSGHY